MKYYILVLSKWYAFLRIFISCQIFFFVVNKKGLRGTFFIDSVSMYFLMNDCFVLIQKQFSLQEIGQINLVQTNTIDDISTIEAFYDHQHTLLMTSSLVLMED